MTSGPLQGRLLKSLVAIKGSRRILEIGTFCGYSAQCMAEAVGSIGSIVTCEIDEDAVKIAQEFIDKSPHASKIKLMTGPAMETLSRLSRSNPAGPNHWRGFATAGISPTSPTACWHEDLAPQRLQKSWAKTG